MGYWDEHDNNKKRNDLEKEGKTLIKDILDHYLKPQDKGGYSDEDNKACEDFFEKLRTLNKKLDEYDKKKTTTSSTPQDTTSSVVNTSTNKFELKKWIKDIFGGGY